MNQKTKFKQTEIGKFPEDWRVVKFGDYVELKHGYQFRNYDFKDNGIKIFKITQIKENGGIDVSNCTFIDESRADEFEDIIIRKGDILMALTGATIGKIARVKEDFGVILQNYRVGNFIPLNEMSVSKDFLYYFLCSEYFLKQLFARTTQSAQENIGKEEIINMIFIIPPLPEQQTIASILLRLDDKIELNQQMNKTLEAIGQAIFKHWFIDFEFSNEKGKPYKSSGGEMVESELGEIPKGWKVGKLGDEFNFTMGQSPPGKSYNKTGEGIIFFQGRTDFGFRYPKNRVYCTSPTRFAEKDSTLLSVRAPVGDLNMTLERCCIGRGLAAIIHKSKNRSYTYYALKYCQPQLESFEAEGTVFGSVNKDNLNKIEITIPHKELIKKFEELIFAIDESVENNEIQIENLSKIRDSLLPKLMSGKIRVPVEIKI